MIAAQSFRELREVEYKIDEFLTRYPNYPEARVLKMQILDSIRPSYPSGRPVPHDLREPHDSLPPSRQKTNILWIIVALLFGVITVLYLIWP